MENIEPKDIQTKSFFGTFVLIYAVLNVVAFFILLLTSKWGTLTGDKSSPFMAGLVFMFIGIAAALICGVGPALVLRKKRKSGWMYAFPIALLIAGVSGAILWELTEQSVFSYAVLLCTSLAAPLYNCLVFNHSPLFNYMANALVVMAPILYASVIYLSVLVSQKRALRAVEA